MSVNSEITRIKNAKAAIKAAIEGKGVTVGNGKLDTFAARIAAISTAAAPDFAKPLIEGTIYSFEIPGDVTAIRDYMFYKCTSIKVLTIPPNVSGIGEYALDIGSSAEGATIIMKSSTPPVIQTNTIGGNVEKIIVPGGTLSDYQSATNWADFAEIIVSEEPKEKWILNAAVDCSTSVSFDIPFRSYGSEYHGLQCGQGTSVYPELFYLDTSYDPILVYSENDFGESVWESVGYRTIGLYAPADGELLAWLEQNATRIAETWVLDKNAVPDLNYAGDYGVDATVQFISDYTQFAFIRSNSNGELYYGGTMVCTAEPAEWTDEAYKTLHFLSAPSGDLLAWLESNGTKQ